MVRDAGTGQPKAQALARRLLDADIAHPVPSGSAWGLRDLTVVIPVRDREAELGRCLAGLAQVPRVIVVDDCSRDPAAVARSRAAWEHAWCAAR